MSVSQFLPQFANNYSLDSAWLSALLKSKMAILLSSSFPPTTNIHYCTHALTHTHARTHSPDFHHVGESQAMPSQTKLSRAKERNTRISLPMSGSTKWLQGVPQGSVLGPIPFLIRCCSVALTSHWLAPPFL